MLASRHNYTVPSKQTTVEGNKLQFCVAVAHKMGRDNGIKALIYIYPTISVTSARDIIDKELGIYPVDFNEDHLKSEQD